MARAVKTHIGQRGAKKGLRVRCQAKKECPFQSDEEHFYAPSIKHVDKYNELLLTEKVGEKLSSAQAKLKEELEAQSREIYEEEVARTSPVKEPLPTKEVRYSFLEDFKKKEKEFDDSFEGFPTRFFNAELRHKDEIFTIHALEMGLDSEDYLLGYIHPSRSGQRLTAAVTSPADLKTPTEDVLKTFKDLGFELTDENLTDGQRTHYRADRSWVVEKGGQKFIVIDGSTPSKNFRKYSWRRWGEGSYEVMDLRALNGLARVKRKTGIDVAEGVISETPPRKVEHDRVNRKVIHNENYEAEREEFLARQKARKKMMIEATYALEEAQREGNNFRSQKKYVREANGTIATVWMDKKAPNPTHVKAAKESRLRSHFSGIEIDNDVDLAEFKSFEDDFMKASEKLPKIPGEKQPVLRIRKLGKHRATGVFSPAHNTIAIDVATSQSTIHELGHYYDLVAKNNSSLSGEFSEIVRDYGRGLKMPPGSEGSKAKADDPEYYKTPTEVFARGFELYSHEKLGIGGRVLRPSRHSDFDYAPFQEEPRLKEKVFNYFDELFSE